MLIIGFSKLRAWRRCHRLYWYRYILFLKRRKPRVQLIRGTILHAMLDAAAVRKDPYKILKEYEKEYGKLFLEEREEYGDLIANCRQIFDAYRLAYAEDGYKVLFSEYEVQIPLPGIPQAEAYFRGHIDKILLDPRKRRWVAEHKSHKNIPGEEARFSDLQTVLYAWAWNLLNPRRPVDGIVWDYLRTKLPAVPEELKSGRLSQRANIDTTYDVASAAVVAHCKRTGENPKDYAEWLENLRGREDKFFKRVYLPNPPKQMIQTLVDEMVTTTKEILRSNDDTTRNLTKDCAWCSFYLLCHAELRGQDSEFIRKSEYVVDEELRDEEAHAEED
jgi:hypothetical protein